VINDRFRVVRGVHISLLLDRFMAIKEKKMNKMKLFLLVGLGLLGGLIPLANADEWDQKTTITFSGPVEISGQVLQAGTYVFKLADSQSTEDVVQVYSADEKHLYGSFLSIPEERSEPTDSPVVTLEEGTTGAPEAVKAWFYPGEDIGHEFVYSQANATE
jgi:hypothetical protein